MTTRAVVLDREITALAYTRTRLGGQYIYDRDPDNDTTVWAAERVLSANNQISFRQSGGTLITVLTSDRVYIIRHDDLTLFPLVSGVGTPPGMMDDDGLNRHIQGHARQGRQRYAEILCRL